MLDINNIFKFSFLLQKSFEISLETINSQQSQTIERPWLNYLFSFIEHHIVLKAILVAMPIVILIFVIGKYNWNKLKTIITTFTKAIKRKKVEYILENTFREHSEKESEEKYVNNYINELNCNDSQKIVMALTGLQQCQHNEKAIDAILMCLFNNKKNIPLRNTIIKALNSMLNSA